MQPMELPTQVYKPNQPWHIVGQLNTFSRFIMIGGLSFVVDLSVFLSLLNLAQWDALLARVTAFTVGLSLTWLGHRKFTFRHRKQRRAKAQMIWVFLVAVVAGMANLMGFQLMRNWLHTVFNFDAEVLSTLVITSAPEVLSVSFGVLVGLIVNWIGSNYLTFKTQHQ